MLEGLKSRVAAQLADRERRYAALVTALANGMELPIETVEKECHLSGRILGQLPIDVEQFRMRRAIERNNLLVRISDLKKLLRDKELEATAERAKIPDRVEQDLRILHRDVATAAIHRGEPSWTANDLAAAHVLEARPQLTKEYMQRIENVLNHHRGELAKAEQALRDL